MRLILLRHGTAVPHDADGFAEAERPLTDEGRDEARAAGRALMALGVEPAAIVTSPYVRARQTAEVAAKALGVEVVEEEALASGFQPDELGGVLDRHEGAPLVLVGHDPDLSQLVTELTGARVRLAKGGVAEIELGDPGSAGVLRFLLRPKQLRLIARSG